MLCMLSLMHLGSSSAQQTPDLVLCPRRNTCCSAQLPQHLLLSCSKRPHSSLAPNLRV